jgi:hypothetical protein
MMAAFDTSVSRKRIEPDAGFTMPMIELIVVVLPMPLRPISVTTSPGFTSKLIPNSAWLVP